MNASRHRIATVYITKGPIITIHVEINASLFVAAINGASTAIVTRWTLSDTTSPNTGVCVRAGISIITNGIQVFPITAAGAIPVLWNDRVSTAQVCGTLIVIEAKPFEIAMNTSRDLIAAVLIADSAVVTIHLIMRTNSIQTVIVGTCIFIVTQHRLAYALSLVIAYTGDTKILWITTAISNLDLMNAKALETLIGGTFIFVIA
jgi:hypothetical protein